MPESPPCTTPTPLPRAPKHPRTARDIATALAERAAPLCHRYLPHGHREGRYWFVGDLHGAQGRSLWVRLDPPGRPGRWTDSDTGQRGDLLDLVRRCLGNPPLNDAIEHARAFLDATEPTTRREAPSQHELRRREAPARLWNLCRPIHGSHAEAYLEARGLEHCHRHRALRFHRALFYRDAHDTHRELPALVAALTNHAGELTGVHRTYLDPHRTAAANVPEPRKSLGRIHRCAVALGPPRHTLLVAQSVESALALRTACPDLPVAATLNAANLSVFTPPVHTPRLLIARDNDAASLRAAEHLLDQCRRRSLTARSSPPPCTTSTKTSCTAAARRSPPRSVRAAVPSIEFSSPGRRETRDRRWRIPSGSRSSRIRSAGAPRESYERKAA